MCNSLESEIVEAALWLEEKGLNQGTTGNVSLRCSKTIDATQPQLALNSNRVLKRNDIEDLTDAKNKVDLETRRDVEAGRKLGNQIRNQFLITPSGVPYRRLTQDMIVVMDLDDPDGLWQGEHKPSSEWRFHRDILNDRPEINVVIHCHSQFATALAVNRVDIPAFHYMVAAFGGNEIRCAPYARFGTDLLSDYAVETLKDRMGCLLANHGMIAIGKTMEQACWYAQQLEALAAQFWHAQLFGSLCLLTDEQMAEARSAMQNYI